MSSGAYRGTPNSLAIYLIVVFSLGGLGTWGIFSGHVNAVMFAVVAFTAALMLFVLCGIAFLLFEAVRILLSM